MGMTQGAKRMQDTRRGWQGLAILAAWLLAGSCHALDVKDDRGHVVQLAKPPQRVISLLPSLTESVCALGACDRLVAVDKWSNWPRQVQQLPKSGAMEDANVELLVSLRPDVVLVAQSSKLASAHLSSEREPAWAEVGLVLVAWRFRTASGRGFATLV
jgi:ABC-type hemin transport system substrate-binding protein